MRGRSYYDLPQFNDKSSVTTRPALPTHLSSPRKRGIQPGEREAAAARAPLASSKHFCQAFPNLSHFCPSFSKDSFGGFVGFQGVTGFQNRKRPLSKLFAFLHALHLPPRQSSARIAEGDTEAPYHRLRFTERKNAH
jgi:hypothetical protein